MAESQIEAAFLGIFADCVHYLPALLNLPSGPITSEDIDQFLPFIILAMPRSVVLSRLRDDMGCAATCYFLVKADPMEKLKYHVPWQLAVSNLLKTKVSRGELQWTNVDDGPRVVFNLKPPKFTVGTSDDDYDDNSPDSVNKN